VIPVTAKHNLRRIYKNDRTFHAKKAGALLPSTTVPDDPEEAEFLFGDLDWVPSTESRIDLCDGMNGADGSRAALWDFGFGISIGGAIDKLEERFTKETHSFALARPEFTPFPGQKVGIAVLFSNKSKPTPATVTGSGEEAKIISGGDLVKIYGEHLHRGDQTSPW